MEFKSGMHQIVDDRKIDFDTIVAKMNGVNPKNAYPMIGWGRKSFIRATCTKQERRTEIEFFTEITFPPIPDRDIGYTEDDAIIFQGVSITDVEMKPDEDGYHPNHGEILPYDEFVDQYITVDATRLCLGRIMEDMVDSMAITDQLIETVNNAWENRNPGQKTLYKVSYQ